MTYPPSGSGYPQAQPPGSYGASAPAAAGSGESQLPKYLTIAVAALGLATYLASFGPLYDTDSTLGTIGGSGSLPSTAALLAGLLAGVGLLPKGKPYTPVVTAVAVLAALLTIASLFDAPDGVSIGWGLWLVLVFTVIQAGIAVAVLLLEAGVITPPAPRPQYDPYQYGSAGGYYGQPGPAQPGYPAQYGGGYPPSGGFAAQPAPPSGGFSAQPAPPQPQPDPSQQTAHLGPATPPTGFPSFSPPPQGAPGQQAPSAAPSGPPQS